MRHPGVPSFLQRTGTLVCLLLIGAGAAFAGEGQLSSDDLELGWSGEVSGIHHWQVREHLQPAAGEWQSLVSKTGPDQIVSRHLDLETVGAISWLPDAVSSETRGESRSISRGWISADGLWRLTQSVQHAGIPYRLDLVIELSRIADSRPSASSVPEIRLLLGPGLGEDPIEGLGIATSMYSYVDRSSRRAARPNESSSLNPAKPKPCHFRRRWTKHGSASTAGILPFCLIPPRGQM